MSQTIRTFFCHIFLFFLLGASVAKASSDKNSFVSDEIDYFPAVKTIFPVFLGAGLGLKIHGHYELDVLFGVTPRPYYEVIGSGAAELGNNPAYKHVIESAFQNNSLWRVGFRYNFQETKRGWHIGLAYSRLRASGEAGIDAVLSSATGLDYTLLINALVARGKSTVVDIESILNIGEIEGGHSWELTKDLLLTASLGVAKVMSADVELKTGLSNFEATNAGKTLITESETELESIIREYGITPTLGVALRYFF